MTTTIRCLYTCDLCKITKQPVDVPERNPATHDVIQWLYNVAVPALVADHSSRSPLCRPQKFTSIAIPVDDATEHIGTKSSS